MGYELTINKNGSYDFYEEVIKAIIGDSADKSLIDLCCCEATVTRKLNFKYKTYVDVLDCWDIPGEMHRFVQTDVLGNHPIFDKRYDVANCSDGIEHLTREDGFKLIKRMKEISDRQVLFTPLGNYMVEENNPDPKCHKSGWLPSDIPDFASIVCPNYHPTLGVGAFWFWKCDNLEEDFERVKNILAKYL